MAACLLSRSTGDAAAGDALSRCAVRWPPVGPLHHFQALDVRPGAPGGGLELPRGAGRARR